MNSKADTFISSGSQLRLKIQKALMNSGYEMLGHGVDAEVWMKDLGKVAKIIISEYSQAPAIKIAEALYKFNQTRKLPNLPRYVNIDGRKFFKFKIGGMPFAQYNMEQLEPLSDKVDLAVVFEFSQAVLDQVPWDKLAREISQRDDLPGRMRAQILKRLKTRTSEYKLFYETLVALYRYGRSRGFSWDLHEENVMRRPGTGELVIVDPWTH